MKSQILLLALIVAALSSCTTAYKTGQTPDDVYFSPTRPHDEYVQVEKKEDNSYRGEDYYGDRYLRMRVQNRYRWSALDDYYFNNPYAYNYYSYYSNWNNPWNSYWTWNNYYNPYCNSGGGIIIKNPTAYKPPPSKPVAFNPSSYLGNTNTTNTQQSGRVKSNGAYYNNSYNSGGTRYNNSNSNSGSGGSNRNSYSNSNSNNNSYTPSSNSTPTRSYTPSSSSSSSSPSSSGSSNSGGGGTSRPKR